MTWARMRFRGDNVWVRVDDAGRPLLDTEGRAEMKYRQEDPRSYRPAVSNLQPDAGAGAGPSPAATALRSRPGSPGAGGAAGASPAPTPRRATRPRRPPAPTAAAATGPDVIHVWTDGACTGNPGPMGIGVVVIAGQAPSATRREIGEFLGVGTNNIAELVAIERGLETAAEIDPTRARPVRVYSDSAYSIGVVSMGWKAKANQDLVARLRKLASGFTGLTFVKVAGHAGVVENERCDELARRAIETRGRT